MLFSERKKGQKTKGDFFVLRKLCSKPYNDLLFEYERTHLGQRTYRYYTENIRHFFLLRTKDPDFLPDNIGCVPDEDGLFDMLECAYQFLKEYNDPKDKLDRSEIFEFCLNEILKDWGYRMRDGIVEILPEAGLIDLTDAKVPANVVPLAEEKIAHAKDLFFKRGATIEAKKSALKVLGEVLEPLRSDLQLDDKLKIDEKTIFDILNNYDIRHHRIDQKDISEPYLTWTYYAQLNTILTFMKQKQIAQDG